MSVRQLIGKRVRARGSGVLGGAYEGRVIDAHDCGFIVVLPDAPEVRAQSARTDGALYHTPEEVQMAEGEGITRDEKIAEIRRELGMRRRVYPRFVREQRMSQEDADHQIAVLEAILADYVGQGDLFEGEG